MIHKTCSTTTTQGNKLLVHLSNALSFSGLSLAYSASSSNCFLNQISQQNILYKYHAIQNNTVALPCLLLIIVLFAFFLNVNKVTKNEEQKTNDDIFGKDLCYTMKQY